MGEWENRLRAARAYAGLSQPELAGRMGNRDKRYIIRIEGGDPTLEDFERQAITLAYAEKCRLPPEFFSADFSGLDPNRPSDDVLRRVERAIDTLQTDLEKHRRESGQSLRDVRTDLEGHGRTAASSKGRLTGIERNLKTLSEALVLHLKDEA